MCLTTLELLFLQFFKSDMHISFFCGVSPQGFPNTNVKLNERGSCFIYGLFVFLLAACFQDYRECKIRNGLIFSGLCWAFCLQVLENGVVGIFNFAEGFGIAFILTYPLFKLRMLGAGDVKLFMVCMGYMGVRRGIIFLCATFLAAAVLALLKMFYYHNFLQRFRYFFIYAGQSIQRAKLSVYDQGIPNTKEGRIRLAGPACLSVLLCLGGLY